MENAGFKIIRGSRIPDPTVTGPSLVKPIETSTALSIQTPREDIFRRIDGFSNIASPQVIGLVRGNPGF